MPFKAQRTASQAIIYPDMDNRMGGNINGPSLIRAPDWLPSPLGRYLLYFADHKGTYLRLAYADALQGPWTIHTPGCLELKDSHFPTELLPTGERPAWVEDASQWYYPHIASPDLHVDHAKRQIRMYFHGMLESGEQVTRIATSADGQVFDVAPDLLAPPYVRAFPHEGYWHALALPNHLLRSRSGFDRFSPGPIPLPPSTRHTAVLKQDHILHVFWSEIGDVPERIYGGEIELSGDWQNWQLRSKYELLRPELAWEGAHEPLVPSVAGAAHEPVNQLRDPCVFADEGRLYLLYSAAGEASIGIAELTYFA